MATIWPRGDNSICKSNTNISKFSIGLGLFDYINPVLYSITTFIIIKNMNNVMMNFSYLLYIIGATMSIIFGFIIPTIKLLVGLNKIKFKLPVNIVFLVNLGILISGITLFINVFKINIYIFLVIIFIILLLFLITFYKTQKFNTIAVLTGALGYIFIYLSLITLSLNKELVIPIILYFIAILLFVFLCLIGIKANLKNAKIHWLIEISNAVCQLCAAIGTLVIFA